MKSSFKLHEVQERKKQEDEKAIDTKPCIVCGKIIPAPYGRSMISNKEVWTCRLSHEQTFQEKRDDYTRRVVGDVPPEV